MDFTSPISASQEGIGNKALREAGKPHRPVYGPHKQASTGYSYNSSGNTKRYVSNASNTPRPKSGFFSDVKMYGKGEQSPSQIMGKLKSGFGKFASAAGHIAGAAYIAAPIFTETGAYNKAKGVTVASADTLGMLAGFGMGGKSAGMIAKLGMSTGVGMVAAGAVEGAFKFQEHLADIGGRQRKAGMKEWGTPSAAMNTQKAVTMRQQSLSQMNRGQQSARSLLGREATMLHR